MHRYPIDALTVLDDLVDEHVSGGSRDDFLVWKNFAPEAARPFGIFEHAGPALDTPEGAYGRFATYAAVTRMGVDLVITIVCS